MKHLFKATKIGLAKEKEDIYFDLSNFTAEEAKQEFKEYHRTTNTGYPYTDYEYDWQKYHNVTYLSKFEDDELLHNDIELLDILLKQQQKINKHAKSPQPRIYIHSQGLRL